MLPGLELYLDLVAGQVFPVRRAPGTSE